MKNSNRDSEFLARILRNNCKRIVCLLNLALIAQAFDKEAYPFTGAGIIMELQCGLQSYSESKGCLTLVQPDTFDLCSSKY